MCGFEYCSVRRGTHFHQLHDQYGFHFLLLKIGLIMMSSKDSGVDKGGELQPSTIVWHRNGHALHDSYLWY